jgi:hypothetical protein
MITSKQRRNNFYLAFRMSLIKPTLLQMIPSIFYSKFREILRLSSRLIEILEASITKVRKSVFEDNGRSIK